MIRSPYLHSIASSSKKLIFFYEAIDTYQVLEELERLKI